MPAVNFRRFSKPEVLSTVEPRLLLRLLSRHEDYFSSRGCALSINGNGCLNYSGIIETLLSPDQRMPGDLIDTLYFTHELATPKGLDAILGALGNGHAAQYRNLTPLDAAIRTYLDAPETFEQVYRQSKVFRRRSFVYFKAFAALIYPQEIPPKLLAKLEKVFSEYYVSRGRGSYCRISVFRQDKELWFTVRHGDPFQREVDVEDPNRASYVFRPERYSTVVLDVGCGELRVNASTEHEEEMCRRCIGSHLFGTEDAFGHVEKFSLSPIVADGLACTAVSDIDGLRSARLTEVKFKTLNSIDENRKAPDLFAMASVAELIPEGASLFQATFRLKFKHARQSRCITIRTPNAATYTHDSDTEMVRQWLAARGISKEGKEIVRAAGSQLKLC